jgi:predicted acetyltransferase
MTIETRLLDPADLASWYAAMNRAYFRSDDPNQAAELRRDAVDFDRTHAAYDGTDVVATFRSFATELTVPGGGAVPADAVTNVSVLATHRRLGLLTGMMRRDLTAARDRGESVAILIASEWPIYGRFGFGMASEYAEYVVETKGLRFTDPGTGTVRYADKDELRKVGPGIYETHRLATSGELERSPLRWDVTFGQRPLPWIDLTKTVGVVCRDDAGTPTGYAVYAVKEEGSGHEEVAVLELDELVATTAAASIRLWRFICEIDLITKVKAPNRSVAEPVRWALADSRALEQVHRSDFLWVRVLDVEAALAARTYLAPGRVVIDVVDELGFATGRYELESVDGKAQCSTTTEPADLTLDVATLGTVYLGGFTVRELAIAGRVVEHSAGAVAVADAMFRSSTTPWSATWF